MSNRNEDEWIGLNRRKWVDAFIIELCWHFSSVFFFGFLVSLSGSYPNGFHHLWGTSKYRANRKGLKFWDRNQFVSSSWLVSEFQMTMSKCFISNKKKKLHALFDRIISNSKLILTLLQFETYAMLPNPCFDRIGFISN